MAAAGPLTDTAPAATAEREAPRRGPLRRLPWWAEALAILVLYESFEFVRGRVRGTPADAFRNAKQVVHVERLLGLYHELGVQRWFLPHKWAVQLWDIYYGTIHFAIPIFALVILYRRAPARYARWRNTLIFMGIVALAGFEFYPLMPPRLLPHAYGFVDTAVRYGGLGPLDRGSMKDVENLYAAMPSLHIGWSTWCAISLFPVLRRPWWRVAVVVYPFATLTAIVATANHYVLDGAGGLGALAVGYAIARGLEWVRRPASLGARRGGFS
jgi:hypothetical protein